MRRHLLLHFRTVVSIVIALLCIANDCETSGQLAAADQVVREVAAPLLREFCFECHGNELAEAKVNLDQLASAPAVATNFKRWRKVADMLEQGKMPPSDALQPDEKQRQQLVSLIRGQVQQTAKEHSDDPGPVTLRRLTSAEYAYSIRDLTGLALNLQRDFVSDAVGGEGFANVGAVQFMQDSTLERYLDAAKQAASHAVIGAGPLGFYEDPGKTGLELSAITRIQNIYRSHGFRTAAGEGGEAFGLDRYPRAFFTAWRYRHRAALGIPGATIAKLADEEGIDARFAQYIWTVFNQPSVSFPTSDVVERWRALPAPSSVIENSNPSVERRNSETDGSEYDGSESDDGQTDDIEAGDVVGKLPRQRADAIRSQCDQIHRVMYDWQIRFGQNADAKEEAPVLAAGSFDVNRSKQFEMNINWPRGTKVAHIQLKIESANRDGRPNAVVVWRDPVIQFRIPDQRRKDPKPLSTLLSAADVGRLGFGRQPVGEAGDANDFVTIGATQVAFELPIRDGATSARLTVTAELDVQRGDDCIVRCTIAQREETDQGKQVSALLANPEGKAFSQWRAGVLEFARLLPQVSHGEPAPSDRDPIPRLFDNSYNNAERNDYHYKIKYYRDDKFLVDNILDNATRRRLDVAWMDLLGSFEYHDTYLRFVAKKFDIDLGGQNIGDLKTDWVGGLPAVPREHIRELIQSFQGIQAAFAAAETGHVEDVIGLASRAWRRALLADERKNLRAYYDSLRDQKLDHVGAVRAMLARVFMAPEFLFRAERPLVKESASSSARPVALTDWELASRLSFFLWSSVPDDELRRVAAAGKLREPETLTAQTRRMLRDPKARRLATEFFGQWFGFYQFDRYRGIDPKQFPEFTDTLKIAMHDEAVTFFEHIIRNDRPVGEMLFAEYAFLNDELAAHYGVTIEPTVTSQSSNLTSSTDHGLVADVGHHRGGLLGLGAILTATSAPLRTSPVKRGDWVLRRVLGTPVPPPPADAGSIAAGDVVSDGLTVRRRLEAHRGAASCRNCHSRIDPLGFALEQYDAIGRWREEYRDGQAIDVSGELSDGRVITGTQGLRDYLRDNVALFHRTLCTKLVGYAMGRRESISDVLLIERMMADIQDVGSFNALVERIVHSRQFRYRRSDRFQSLEARKPNE